MHRRIPKIHESLKRKAAHLISGQFENNVTPAEVAAVVTGLAALARAESRAGGTQAERAQPASETMDHDQLGKLGRQYEKEK